MVSINYSAREVCCKIVYYGPGLSGKTTNLQYVHSKVPATTRGKLISLATEADRTLYFDFLPINIGTIKGGDWHSTVPQEVVVTGRYGVFPGEDLRDARHIMSEALEKAAQADPWLREHPPVLEWIEGQFESGQTSSDHPVVTTLASAHQSVMGTAPPLKGVTWGADLRLFTNHADTPAVLYGPGDVSLAHGPDEYVELEQVLDAAKVIALAIYQWCGGSFR